MLPIYEPIEEEFRYRCPICNRSILNGEIHECPDYSDE